MKKVGIIVLLIMAMLLVSCGRKTASEGPVIYYLNDKENTLIGVDYKPQVTSAKGQIEEIRNLMDVPPEGGLIKTLLPDNVKLEAAVLDGSVLSLHFNEEYKRMSGTREVLARAGIVRTFTQIEDVQRVLFYVGTEPLKNADGSEIGLMRRESFMDNSAQNVNNYERDEVRLYFASQDGKTLIEEPRAIYHTSSQPLEWAVVARIIEGPKAEGSYPTVPSDVEIISVSTSQDICYVNLSGSFLNNTLAVTEEIPIYSIVNSIVESCNVSQVQISVEGDSKVVFREKMDLSLVYEENKSLIG